MPHVGQPGLWDRIVVDVNDLVEIASDNLCDIKESVKVKRLVCGNKTGESNGGQVAHSYFVRGCVLHNLSAEVARLDGAKILCTRKQSSTVVLST